RQDPEIQVARGLDQGRGAGALKRRISRCGRARPLNDLSILILSSGKIVKLLCGAALMVVTLITSEKQGPFRTAKIDPLGKLLRPAIAPQASLRLRRSQREAMATHDFRHLCPVRRTAGRLVDHLGTLSEILRALRGRRNHAERLHVLIAVIVKPVNGATWNA